MAVKTYIKGSTTKLSKNFSVYEFRCGLGRPCSCTTTLIDDDLVQILQKIRDHFGKTVRITSGHRCADYNRSVSKATASRHTKGQAADIVVVGVKPAEVAKYAESIGVLGIGLYETTKDGHFVHVDTRTTKAFWYGQAQAKRTTFGGTPAPAAPAEPAASATEASGYTLTQFVKDIQKATGAAVDGVAGPRTLAKTVTISKSKNRRHAAVQAIQKRLAALGYTQVGKADGVAGNKFDQALKAYQKDTGCVLPNGEPDGELTARGKTWRKMLGME